MDRFGTFVQQAIHIDLVPGYCTSSVTMLNAMTGLVTIVWVITNCLKVGTWRASQYWWMGIFHGWAFAHIAALIMYGQKAWQTCLVPSGDLGIESFYSVDLVRGGTPLHVAMLCVAMSPVHAKNGKVPGTHCLCMRLISPSVSCAVRVRTRYSKLVRII